MECIISTSDYPFSIPAEFIKVGKCSFSFFEDFYFFHSLFAAFQGYLKTTNQSRDGEVAGVIGMLVWLWKGSVRRRDCRRQWRTGMKKMCITCFSHIFQPSYFLWILVCCFPVQWHPYRWLLQIDLVPWPRFNDPSEFQGIGRCFYSLR